MAHTICVIDVFSLHWLRFHRVMTFYLLCFDEHIQYMSSNCHIIDWMLCILNSKCLHTNIISRCEIINLYWASFAWFVSFIALQDYHFRPFSDCLLAIRVMSGLFEWAWKCLCLRILFIAAFSTSMDSIDIFR